MCIKNKQRARNETLRLQRFGRSSWRTGCYDITSGRSLGMAMLTRRPKCRSLDQALNRILKDLLSARLIDRGFRDQGGGHVVWKDRGPTSSQVCRGIEQEIA